LADESGLSQRPHRVRTWAPRGKTPVLQYCFNWKSLPVAAGLTAWNFYFRLYPGAIKSPQVVDFLNALVRAIRRDMTENRLRHGALRSVEDLITAIFDYVDYHNEHPKPFIWTAKASDILEKVKRDRAAQNNRQSA